MSMLKMLWDKYSLTATAEKPAKFHHSDKKEIDYEELQKKYIPLLSKLKEEIRDLK